MGGPIGGTILVIKEANDANGVASGTLQMGSVFVDVNIHYHFQNSSGPATSLSVWGWVADPNSFVGAAGVTNNGSYAQIELKGGVASTTAVQDISGVYKRR